MTANNTKTALPMPSSWKKYSVKFRRKRMRAFEEFYREKIAPPLGKATILDLGGTVQYWKSVEFKYFDTAEFTLLNLEEFDVPEDYSNITSVAGDATDLHGYADKQFDLVFSNSCIEHVGGFEAQKRMAAEMVRTGKHYYLQTPNKWFILDPHWRVPFVHLFPRRLLVFLVERFQLGGMPRAGTKEEAERIVDSVRLMTERELRQLFPEADIRKEKFFFLTKSFCLFSK